LAEILAAPPLPTRRPGAAPIPTSHPHSRKISINTPILPPHDSSRPGSPIELPSIPESRSIHEAGPSRPSSRSTQSSSASGSRSRLNLNSDDSRTSSETSRRPPRSPLGQDHARTPSYQNAYGASYPTPPTHPYSRSRQPTEPWGTTTVLWAYTRLIGQFHPSNQYIPPDPLLPLRSLMLHQPVGSGSLASTPTAESSGMKSSSSTSRWQMSFGTGAIGHKSQPSLTGSLFGLAKDLVTGGGGGTLEEERRRVWQAKDLPVLETARSLLGVDIKLKEGETKECKSVSDSHLTQADAQSRTRLNYPKHFRPRIEDEHIDSPTTWYSPSPSCYLDRERGRNRKTYISQSESGPISPSRNLFIRMMS